ncbi:MAG: hypothetical protein ACPGXY_06140 [Alphaproteobacteria bacterium]
MRASIIILYEPLYHEAFQNKRQYFDNVKESGQYTTSLFDATGFMLRSIFDRNTKFQPGPQLSAAIITKEWNPEYATENRIFDRIAGKSRKKNVDNIKYTYINYSYQHIFNFFGEFNEKNHIITVVIYSLH